MFGIKTWFAKRNRPNPDNTRPGGTRWRSSSIMGLGSFTGEAEPGKTNSSKEQSIEDESQKNHLA